MRALPWRGISFSSQDAPGLLPRELQAGEVLSYLSYVLR